MSLICENVAVAYECAPAIGSIIDHFVGKPSDRLSSWIEYRFHRFLLIVERSGVPAAR
jgi:hypothetical protein